MSLHIAAVGDWTRSLYQLVKDGQDEQVSNPSLLPSDTCMHRFQRCDRVVPPHTEGVHALAGTWGSRLAPPAEGHLHAWMSTHTARSLHCAPPPCRATRLGTAFPGG